MSVTVSDMQRRVAAGLSMRSRAGYTLLLVVSIAMAAIATALLATESELPDRTRLAFAGVAVIGVAWAALASYVLARRHVLFAQHRIAASYLALVASGLFLAGAVMLQPHLAPAVLGVAALMMAAALACVVQAHRYRMRLIERRDALVATSKGQP